MADDRGAEASAGGTAEGYRAAQVTYQQMH